MTQSSIIRSWHSISTKIDADAGRVAVCVAVRVWRVARAPLRGVAPMTRGYEVAPYRTHKLLLAVRGQYP
jgi:hypothetical protein